jgi:hypothetical protein
MTDPYLNVIHAATLRLPSMESINLVLAGCGGTGSVRRATA